MKNMVPFIYIVFLLATQASSQELSSTLHSTAYGAQYAFDNEMVTFTCVVRGSNSMAWTSDEYIGVGVRLPLFSVQGIGHEVPALGKDETLAVLVNSTTGSSDLVIVSELRIRVKSAYPVASVRCLNSGANTATSTSFFLADTTLVTCDRLSVCPGDAVTCTCITGNSTSLAWISNGNRLMFTSDDALQTQRNIPGSSIVAVLTENSNVNGIGVIMSNITVTASSSDSELLLTCENIDRTMTKPNIIPIPRIESCPVNPTDEDTTPTDPGSENAPARNTCSGPIAAAVVVPIIIIVLVIIVAIVIIIVAPKKIREHYVAQLKEKDHKIENLEAEKRTLAQELSDLREKLKEKDEEIGTFNKDVETKTREVDALKERVKTMDGQMKQKDTELNDLKNSIEKMKKEAMENLEKTMKEDQKRVLDELETKMKAEIDEVLGKGKSGEEEQAATPAGLLKSKLKERILAALTELNVTTDKEIKKASQTRTEWLISAPKRIYQSLVGSSS